MDTKLFEQVVEELKKMTPEEHSKVLAELMNLSKERFLKESEIFAIRSKELSEFIKNRLP